MKTKTDFDLIIIGSGPGGYVAAIRAAQLGKKTTIIERDQVGGICLNWGCIPTKALLKNAEVLTTIQNAAKFGIQICDYQVDWQKVIKRSRNISKRLGKGVEYLLNKNQITLIQGNAKLNSNTEIEVINEEGYISREIFLLFSR